MLGLSTETCLFLQNLRSKDMKKAKQFLMSVALVVIGLGLTGCTLDGESPTTDNLFQSAAPAAETADTSSDDSSSAQRSSDTSSNASDSSSSGTTSAPAADTATTTSDTSDATASQSQDQSTTAAAAPEPAAEPAAAAPASTSSGPTGGFVWKPVSEGDGNLVILLPSSSGATSLNISGSGGSEGGRYVGRTNGERPTFRYSAPGCAYGTGVSVVSNLGESYTIGNGCSRTEF